MKSVFRSAVNRLYLYQALSYTFFDRAIFTIYLAQNGVSFGQIGLLQSLLFAAIFVAEAPMGALGDRFGRKRLIVLGRLCIVAYSLLMLVGGPFPVFVLAFLLIGLGEAAVSGADSALLYENARREGRADDFTRIASRFHGIAAAAVAVGMFGGGLLQDISWSTVFLASAGLHLVGTGVVAGVTDAREVDDEGDESLRAIVAHVATVLRTDRDLAAFMLGAALLGSSINTLFIYAPVLLDAKGFDTTFVAGTMALAAGLAAVASFQAWRVVQWTGDRLLFASLPIACAALMASISVVPVWAVPAAIIIVVLTEDLLEPIVNRVINDRVPDSVRASALSLYSAAYSVFAVLLFPVMGWVAEVSSFAATVVALGVCSLCCVALLPRGTEVAPSEAA